MHFCFFLISIMQKRYHYSSQLLEDHQLVFHHSANVLARFQNNYIVYWSIVLLLVRATKYNLKLKLISDQQRFIKRMDLLQY